MTDCVFVVNSSAENGGGIENLNFSGSAISITNCKFVGNAAGGNGGGLDNYNGVGGAITVTNCTFSANTAPNGAYGGIYNYTAGIAIALTNDIVYGDVGGEVGGTGFTAAFCDIQGGYAGTGNINADPLFVHVAGYDVHLYPGSPCLGAGTPNGAPSADLDGVLRPNPPSIGAYEFAPLATTLTLINPTGAPGQTVSLTARLRQTSGGVTLSGKMLTFQVDGAVVGTAATNSSGLATLAYAIPGNAAAGSHALTASFAGDSAYKSGSVTGTLTVTAPKANTTMTIINAAGTRGQAVSLTARLRQTVGGAYLSGRTLSFSVDGATVGTAVTGSTGLGTLHYVIPAGATVGSHVLKASFAGDSGNNPSSVTGTLTVH